MMDILLAVFVFALLIEAIVEAIVWTIESLKKLENGWNPERVIALVISVALAVIYSVDVFELLGFDAIIPYVGSVATGVIVSRGANFVSDLFAKLGDRRTS